MSHVSPLLPQRRRGRLVATERPSQLRLLFRAATSQPEACRGPQVPPVSAMAPGKVTVKLLEAKLEAAKSVKFSNKKEYWDEVDRMTAYFKAEEYEKVVEICAPLVSGEAPAGMDQLDESRAVATYNLASALHRVSTRTPSLIIRFHTQHACAASWRGSVCIGTQTGNFEAAKKLYDEAYVMLDKALPQYARATPARCSRLSARSVAPRRHVRAQALLVLQSEEGVLEIREGRYGSSG